MLSLVLLGLLAGLVTTVAGMGGGLFLIVALGVSRGPHAALALSAPALLLANLHRAWLFRAHIDRDVATRLAAGAIPGAILGGLLLPAIPEAVVAGLLATTTVLALLRQTGRLRFDPGRAGLVLGSALVGMFAGTSGGAAILMAPLVLAAGLHGERYLATIAIAAIALHIGRVLAYGSVGLLGVGDVPAIAALLVGLVVGNLCGRRVRRFVPARLEPVLELGALVATTLLAVVTVLG
jgi:uncharacterized membrane protein YfcA